jgi:hypothetical protein
MSWKRTNFLPSFVALAFGLAVQWPAYGQTQMRQTQSTPGLTGLPYPTSATASRLDIPPAPGTDREVIKRQKVWAYKRMTSDTTKIQQLASELNKLVETTLAPGDKQDPQQAAADAVKSARKIEKLAAEVDQLMRDD